MSVNAHANSLKDQLGGCALLKGTSSYIEHCHVQL